MPSTSIYLDNAATTPTDPRVLEAMRPFLEDEFANPSSIYGAARTTREALEKARKVVADILGAKPTEIIWTSGGTESINLAIQGVLRAHPGAGWVTTSIEHDAVLAERDYLSRDGHEVVTVDVKPSGIVDPNGVTAAITDETILVSVMLANNEIGTIQPVAEIAKELVKIRADRRSRGVKLPLYLHTDACQAAGYLALHVERLGVDLLTLNGSKIYGPKGSGILYVRTGVTIEPLLYGGGQERGRRSGTESVASAVGLAKALELVVADRQAESKRQAVLRDELACRLLDDIPRTVINGDMRHRLPNNLNLLIPGAEGQAMVMYLDNVGIMASTGSACSSGDLDPSHVLLAIGRSNAEATSSLRLTLGRHTTQTDIRMVAEHLPKIVERLRTLDA
jgi:cysteine desulfurase